MNVGKSSRHATRKAATADKFAKFRRLLQEKKLKSEEKKRQKEFSNCHKIPSSSLSSSVLPSQSSFSQANVNGEEMRDLNNQSTSQLSKHSSTACDINIQINKLRLEKKAVICERQDIERKLEETLASVQVMQKKIQKNYHKESKIQSKITKLNLKRRMVGQALDDDKSPKLNMSPDLSSLSSVSMSSSSSTNNQLSLNHNLPQGTFQFDTPVCTVSLSSNKEELCKDKPTMSSHDMACDLCDKTFSTRFNLLRHQRNIHKTHTEIALSKKEVIQSKRPCIYCDQMFSKVQHG
jgi:hypothetical protein